MKIEIIITCRGELPDILQRTVRNIMATKRKADVVTVVLDGPHPGIAYRLPDGVNTIQPFDEPRGPGQCRDWATMHSEADVVVFVDGHMTFPTDWTATIAKHFSAKGAAKDVTCAHMQGLDHGWIEIDGEAVYDGCHLELTSMEQSRKNWAINAVWNKERLAEGPVGAVMGACYAMKRNWYRAMGRPLAVLGAWGGDEEILSLASWLAGGRCYLLPVICGHIWAAPRERPGGNAISVNEWRQIWANQYAIMECIADIVPEPERGELIAFLDRGNNRNEIMREIAGSREKEIMRVRNALNTALDGDVNAWDRLKMQNIIRPVTPPVTAAPAVVTAAPTVSSGNRCQHCGTAVKNYGKAGFHSRCPTCRRIVA
jgi:hypothetical protein